MSVIVYHHGVMASDSRAYSGDTHPIGTKRKIHRIEEGPHAGSLLGICSNVVGTPDEFKAWIEGGAPGGVAVPADPSFEAILIKPDGDAFFFNDSYTATGPIVADTFTLGSGKKYALGAIKAGAGVVDAVKIAIECDVWCGGPVVCTALDEPEFHTIA
jgi:ATP-dependent protease HslVU (ClpYQ) peptidase subunit